jgi:hypothetical protein
MRNEPRGCQCSSAVQNAVVDSVVSGFSLTTTIAVFVIAKRVSFEPGSGNRKRNSVGGEYVV